MGLTLCRAYSDHCGPDQRNRMRTALYNNGAFCYILAKLHLIFDNGNTFAHQHNKTFLHAAIQKNHLRLAKNLIAHASYDVNAQDDRGETPLHYAVNLDNLEAVNFLIDYGADADITAANNYTPFMNAVILDRPLIAKVLLEHCQHFSWVNTNGRPFLQMARLYQRRFLFADGAYMFKKMWAKLDHHVLLRNSPEKRERTPFFVDLIRHTFNFDKTTWVECMTTVLESPGALNLVNDFMKVPESLSTAIEYLVCSFDHVKVEQGDRLRILRLCFRIGCPISFQDINVTYLYFGYNKELDIVVRAFKPLPNRPNLTLTSILGHILSDQNKPSPKEVLWSFVMYRSHFFRIPAQLREERDIFNQLEFFALSAPIKDALVNVARWCPSYCKVLSKKLASIPSVPSLLELSRNRVHGCLRPKFKHLLQYYNCVDHLVVPQNLKDVLCFKIALYKSQECFK